MRRSLHFFVKLAFFVINETNRLSLKYILLEKKDNKDLFIFKVKRKNFLNSKHKTVLKTRDRADQIVRTTAHTLTMAVVGK